MKNFVLGLTVGILLTYSIVVVVWYSFIESQIGLISVSNYERIKKDLNEKQPPTIDIINQRISTLSHREKAFALINYNSARVLSENEWFPVDEKNISLLERKALREFAIENDGFEEYKSFLQFKYGSKLKTGTKEAVINLPLP